MILLGGLLYLLVQFLSKSEGSLFDFVSTSMDGFVAFALLGTGLVIAMNVLYLLACLGTRTEALGVAARDDQQARVSCAVEVS